MDQHHDEIIDAEALPCREKLAFATREQADAVAAVNAFRYKGNKLRAYRCRYCGLWHLSSQPVD